MGMEYSIGNPVGMMCNGIFGCFCMFFYPVVNGGSDKRSELEVFTFQKDIPYEKWGAKELLRVSQPSNSHSQQGTICNLEGNI